MISEPTETSGSFPQWSVAPSPTDAGAEPGVGDGARANHRTLVDESRYVRGEILGVGGMGVVHVAFDTKLERHVALKVLRLDQTDRVGREAMRARLMREARLTARLDHPGVVSVFDVGEQPDGVIFYTMRIVRGQTMSDALKGAPRDGSGRLATPHRERMLRALLSACDAVGFGHRLGVVHRDLKPANLMVGEFGETQVVDWGLAVALDGPLSERQGVAGTPAYMSPEQAVGGAVDPRSDVWSLGAVLHELVTGRAPHVDKARSDSPIQLVERAGSRQVPAVSGVELELAAIIARALSQDPDGRYPDAKALATDLASYLDGRRVLAHDYTSWQLMLRLVRQWRGPLLGLLLALVAGGVALGVGVYEAGVEREHALAAEKDALQASARASKAEQQAVQALADATDSLQRMLVSRAMALHSEGARPEAEVLASRALSLAPSPEAQGVILALGLAPRPTLISEVAMPPSCRENTLLPNGKTVVCRTPTELALWDLEPLRERWRRDLPNLHTPALLADGTLVTFDRGQLILLDPQTGKTLATTQSYVNAVARDGEAVALVSGVQRLTLVDKAGRVSTFDTCQNVSHGAGSGPLTAAIRPMTDTGGLWAAVCGDGTLHLGGFEALAGEAPRLWLTRSLPSPLREPATIAFAPSGTALLAADHAGGVCLLSLEEQVLIKFSRSTALSPIREVTVSPDGRLGLIVGERTGLALIDLETGAWLTRLPMSDQRSARFTGPRELLTSGKTLKRWHLPEPTPIVLEHGSGVASLALARDGEVLSIGVGAGEVLERWHWSTAGPLSREPPRDLAGITVKSLTSRDDLLFAVSAGASGIIWVPWWGEGGGAFGGDRARRVAWVRELNASIGDPQAWTVTASYGPLVRAMGLAGGEPAGVATGPPDELLVPWFGEHEEEHQDLTAAPGNAAAILLAVNGQRARRVVARHGVSVDRELDVGSALAAAIERDGETLWTVSHDRLDRWDVDSGALLLSFAVPDGALIEVAVSDYDQDGLWVAAGDRFGGTWLWSVDGEEVTLVARFADHSGRVAALAFSPGVDALVTGSWDGTVRLRALRSVETVGDIEKAWGLTSSNILAP